MAYLSGARGTVAGILTAALPDLQVYAWPNVPDSLLDDSVVVTLTGAGPASVAVLGVTRRLDVWAVSATTVGEGSEDDLEALTDSVLMALDAAGIQWTDTERGVFQEHPAYRIEVET